MTSTSTNGGAAPPIGPRSWYEVLDVQRDATRGQIDDAYDRAIALIEGRSIGGYLMLDPDAREAALREIETAYLVLSDAELRRAFDDATADDHLQTTPEMAADAYLDDLDAFADDDDDDDEEEVEDVGPARNEQPVATSSPEPAAPVATSRPPGPSIVPARASDAAASTAEPGRDSHPTTTTTTTAAPARQTNLSTMSTTRDSAPPSPPRRTVSAPRLRILAPVFDEGSAPIAPAPRPPEKPTPSPQRADASAPSPAPPPTAERAPEEPKKVQPRDGSGAVQPRAPVPSPKDQLPPDLEEVFSGESEVNGQMIRRLREVRGLTVVEVAQATKIQKAYIIAIEEMDLEELPARVYLRGFLTQIARVLRVDKKRLSEGYLRFVERYRA